MNLIKQLFLYCTTLFLLVSCENFPKDPSRTLEKVKNGTLIVGYSEHPPFVIKEAQEPTGIEADLVKSFAKTLNARIEWKNDTEANLFESLKKKEIHLVIAGITKDAPWQDKAGLTRPYLKQKNKKYVMAIQLGENAFLFELEKFLETQKEQVEKQIVL